MPRRRAPSLLLLLARHLPEKNGEPAHCRTHYFLWSCQRTSV